VSVVVLVFMRWLLSLRYLARGLFAFLHRRRAKADADYVPAKGGTGEHQNLKYVRGPDL